LAVTLRYLASGNSYRSFTVPHNIIVLFAVEVCKAIIMQMELLQHNRFHRRKAHSYEARSNPVYVVCTTITRASSQSFFLVLWTFIWVDALGIASSIHGALAKTLSLSILENYRYFEKKTISTTPITPRIWTQLYSVCMTNNVTFCLHFEWLRFAILILVVRHSVCSN